MKTILKISLLGLCCVLVLLLDVVSLHLVQIAPSKLQNNAQASGQDQS